MIVLTPEPVPCRVCFTILKSSYAEQNEGRCPGCGEMVCYTCGCIDRSPCTRESTSQDGLRSVTTSCGWAEEGLCSFCMEEAAYVLYMEATGRTPDDPRYLRHYRTAQTHHVAPALRF